MSPLPAPLARARFEAAVRPAPADFDVVEACLTIAAEEYPKLDFDGCRDRLQALCAGARVAVGAGVSGQASVDRLNRFLFEREGFRGDAESMDDPRGSFLNDVLDRRTGLPIMLSVLYMEVGRSVGVPMEGIGLPGHFVVRALLPVPVLLDPFHGGRILTEEDCRGIVARHAGPEAAVTPFLHPMPAWRIVVRMLTNLKAAYLRKEQHGKAVAALERILHLHPESAEGRDLGLLYLRQGCLALAGVRLAAFVREHPTHPDAAEIASHLPSISETAFPSDRFVRPLRRPRGRG